jgi:hypothetical protein
MGPAGPAGPPGPQGVAGPQGQQGWAPERVAAARPARTTTPATAAVTTPVQAWTSLWTDLFSLQRKTLASLAEAAGTRRSTGR